MELLCPLLARHSPQISTFTHLEALWNVSLLGFMEASLHRHDWLSHCPLVIDWVCILSPFPEISKWDSEFPVTVGSHGNQPPFFGAFQKLTLLVEQDNPVTLEIPRFLGASNKDGYQILVIINYTIMSYFEIFFKYQTKWYFKIHTLYFHL